ncbi:MAG: two-component system LytT family response regulator [Saprospiraceae bacterium]|jgi:two-component system LytT family response regulator
MKLKALIIDDEPLAHKIILEYAKDTEHIDIVGQCYLATDALSVLRNQEINLLFLDINMPKLKGLDFLRTLTKKPLVIITSAYQEYALESFELDVCDYLLKPFRFDRFLKATNKAYELFQLKNADKPPVLTNKMLTNDEQNHLFIKLGKRHVQLNISDIFYVESYGNYVKIWLENEFHLTPRTLTSFEEQLPSNDFFKIHKSFIVNRKHIAYVEGNMVKMKNDKVLTIGKNHRAEFKRFIG